MHLNNFTNSFTFSSSSFLIVGNRFSTINSKVVFELPERVIADCLDLRQDQFLAFIYRNLIFTVVTKKRNYKFYFGSKSNRAMGNTTLKNVTFLLTAHFDNKLGPLLSNQYPKIPKKLPDQLVNLMIPSNIERNQGTADFTIFVLYEDKTNPGTYVLFPNDGSHPIYFLNACLVNLDKENDRGVTIKSVALGSPLKCIASFKPLLLAFLNLSFTFTKKETIHEHLEEFYDMLNSVDLTLFEEMISLDQFHDIVTSLTDRFPPNELGSIIDQLAKKGMLHLPKRSSMLSYEHNILRFQFSEFANRLFPDSMKQISLSIDMKDKSFMNLDLNFNKDVLPLIHKLTTMSVDFHKLDTTIFLSTKMSKDNLSQFVIAFAYILGISGMKHVKIFPYLDISLIDQLENYRKHSSVSKKVHLLIGTSNPMFHLNNSVCDLLCDLDNLKIYKDFKPTKSVYSLGYGKLFSREDWKTQPRYLRKVIKNQLTNTKVNDNIKPTLMTKYFEILLNKEYENQIVINVIKKITNLQVILLLNDYPGIVTEKNWLYKLRNLYAETYKDIVLYSDFLECENIRFVETLCHLYRHLRSLHTSNPVTEIDTICSTLIELSAIFRKTIATIGLNQDMTFKFINTCLNFPYLNILNSSSFKDRRLPTSGILDMSQPGIDRYKTGDLGQSMNSHNIGKLLSHNAFHIINEIFLFDLNYYSGTKGILKDTSRLSRSISLKTFFTSKSITTSNLKSHITTTKTINDFTSVINTNGTFFAHPDNLPEQAKLNLLRSRPLKSSSSLMNLRPNSTKAERELKNVKKGLMKLLDVICGVPLGEDIAEKYLEESVFKAHQMHKKSKPISRSQKSNTTNDSDVSTLFPLDEIMKQKSGSSISLNNNASMETASGDVFFDTNEFAPAHQCSTP